VAVPRASRSVAEVTRSLLGFEAVIAFDISPTMVDAVWVGNGSESSLVRGLKPPFIFLAAMRPEQT
jgi:hypothetical protein